MKNCSLFVLHILAASLALLAGCRSFTVSQSNTFTDEDGNILAVDYGRLSKDYESTFLAPSGKEMKMRSKLAVEVTLPNGDSFTAYECMNPLRSGTMYRSTNEKWMFHANGISCSVFYYDPAKRDYLEIFTGVICQGTQKVQGL